jgi:hypothetical protein
MTTAKTIRAAIAAICAGAAALSSFGDLLHPDVLRMPDGTRIATAKEWSSTARPQILDFFEKNVYGKIPPRPAKLEFVLAEKGDDALGGLAKTGRPTSPTPAGFSRWNGKRKASP